MSRKLHKFQTVAEYQSLVSDGGDTYGLNETLCLNYIPSDVTSLERAFSNWSSLEEVTCEIPSGVTSMNSTFSGCTSLKEVTFLHTTPPSYYRTLTDCSKLETIYATDKSVNAYKTATGWSQFASKIKPLSEKLSE